MKDGFGHRSPAGRVADGRASVHHVHFGANMVQLALNMSRRRDFRQARREIVGADAQLYERTGL